MLVYFNGHGITQSSMWKSPSLLNKTQNVGSNRSMDDSDVADVPHGTCSCRFGSWNVGSTTRRSGEVVVVLGRQKVDMYCVQET